VIGFQSWPGPRRPNLGGAVAASIDRKVGAFDPALRSRAYRRRYRQGARHPVAHRTHGAMLRPAGDRVDGRGLGTAIDHRLKPHLVHGTFDSCPSTKTRGL